MSHPEELKRLNAEIARHLPHVSNSVLCVGAVRVGDGDRAALRTDADSDAAEWVSRLSIRHDETTVTRIHV